MQDNAEYISLAKDKKKAGRLILFIGLLLIVVSLNGGNIAMAMAIVLIPLSVMTVVCVIKKPWVLFMIMFVVNYIIMGISRYVSLGSLGVTLDILILLLFIILAIHSAVNKDVPWGNAKNVLTMGLLIWTVYCLLEVVNPTSIFMAWLLSRSAIYYALMIAILTSVIVINVRMVKMVVFAYGALTFLAIAKVLMQKFYGFDSYEQYWLDNGGARTHILFSGIRYFSFYTDAGNFGSNMGGAAIFFGIIFFYIKNRAYKVLSFILCCLATYTMFMSGTRGAIAVPLAGLAYYSLASKNYKAMAISGLSLAVIYVFFSFTMIGQSNEMIRRMRTAFRPSEDASYIIRKMNQQKLAVYLKNKPFGAGMGLSDGGFSDYGYCFTMTIPNDSWFVKIWVENGVVGLILYIAILVAIVLKCTYIVMFKIKHKQLKGACIAMLCTNVGLFVSAYGNPFLGQFPTLVIVYTFFAIVMVAPKIDDEVSNTAELTK